MVHVKQIDRQSPCRASSAGGPGGAAAGVAEVRRRGDSALEPALGPAKPGPWDQSLLGWLDAEGVGCAISADMSRELAAAHPTWERRCAPARGAGGRR